jgi:branched-chain amino acid transport system substrate-binding protein
MLKLPLAALAAGLALLPGAASAEIKVGVVLALTGPNASLGTIYQKGMSIFPDTIAGEKVRMIVLDDASDPTTAVKNTRKLISEDQVDVIIGPANTPSAFAMGAVTQELKTPMISISPVDLFGDKAEWLVAIAQPADIWILPIVKDIKKRNLKTVGFIGFTDAWGDITYGAMKKVGEAQGLQVTSNERFARADTSVTGQILKILATRPDAIFVGGSGSPGALPHLALAERNWKGPVYETPAIFNQDFIRLGGKAIEGTMGATGPIVVWDQLPDSNPIKQVSIEFRKKFEAVHGPGTANPLAAYGHDAYLVFADAAARAVKRAKPGTPEFRAVMRDELRAIKELVGTHAIYNYGTAGTPYGVDERAAVLARFDNGKWVLMKD